MAEIRPLEPDDIGAVAALLGENLPFEIAGERFERSLVRAFAEPAWSDPELASLVASEDGRVVGFIGAQPRRVRFDDRELRAVCLSHLAVSSESRGGATGALLLRRMLNAGQDFTFSDTANEAVTQMWKTFRAELDSARVCDWMFVLRTGRWIGSLAGGSLPGRTLASDQVPVGALPFKALRPGRAATAGDSSVSGSDASSAELVEGLEQMAAGVRLRVDYDAAYLDRVFGDVEEQFGPVVRRIVRREGRPVGWYAYVTRGGGAIRVLHLLCDRREGEPVIDELLTHAREGGGTVITGRLEPHLVVPLQARLPTLGLARRPWLHCRDAELRGVLGSSASLLTLLDGEWFVT